MPNGGSDCCGTCWFNSKNEGKPGYHGSTEGGMVHCSIRQIEIENPFYTYCTNHPHHNPDKIEVPIGPVYAGEERTILHQAPDTPAAQEALVAVLKAIEEKPDAVYPAGVPIDDQAIDQAGKLGIKAAVPELRRILTFDPQAVPKGENHFDRSRFITLGHAIESLARIEENDALEDIEAQLFVGLEKAEKAYYDSKEDKHAVIRYHAVRGLKNTEGTKTIDLLVSVVQQEPHHEVRAFARDILHEKATPQDIAEIEFEQLKASIIPPADYAHRNGFSNREIIENLSAEASTRIETWLLELLERSDDILIGETLVIMDSKKSIQAMHRQLYKADSPVSKITWASYINELVNGDDAMKALALTTFDQVAEKNLDAVFYTLAGFKDDQINSKIRKYINHSNYLLAYNAQRALGISVTPRNIWERIKNWFQ